MIGSQVHSLVFALFVVVGVPITRLQSVDPHPACVFAATKLALVLAMQKGVRI